MKPLELSKQEFDNRRREGDGICSLCQEWTLGKAEPKAEHGYCPECDNRTLSGVDVALTLGLITVRITVGK